MTKPQALRIFIENENCEYNLQLTVMNYSFWNNKAILFKVS